MTKTPEEMAEEHANLRCPEQGAEFIVWCMCRDDFLAGYQAAMNSLEKLDSCDHILDMEKMVDVNFSNNSNGWISVKERLPEINKGFIGFAENKEVCNCYRYPDHSEDGRPVFYAQTKTGLLICGLESISHWAPLPEPPEEA